MNTKWLVAGAVVLCAKVSAQDVSDKALQEIARLESEINLTIEQQNQRPRKTYITPSTRSVAHAMYYSVFRRRVEQVGTSDFPQVDGQKLYGKVILAVPIGVDGKIYENDGGVRVERSSGNSALDAAAIHIVQRSAPFGKLPKNMLSPEKDDVWVLIGDFNFTREEAPK